jgi:hypothetical protein
MPLLIGAQPVKPGPRPVGKTLSDRFIDQLLKTEFTQTSLTPTHQRDPRWVIGTAADSDEVVSLRQSLPATL